MAKKQQPFLPMFVGDFMAATAEWEGEEQALYALLLMHQWALGHLPTGVAKLARLVKYDQHNFERWWPTVACKFDAETVPGFGDRLVNHRLEQHRAKTIELSKKNSVAGKLGAVARKRKNSERLPDGSANANGSRSERHKSASTAIAKQSIPSYPIPSHPDPSQNQASPSPQEVQAGTPTPRARTRANGSGHGDGNGGPDAAHELRIEIEATYPKGLHRGDHWMLAERSIRTLLEEGEEAEQLLDAAAKYCAQQTALGNLGKHEVLRPSTFFGTAAWRGPFPIAASAAAPVKRMRTAHEIAEELDPNNTALSGR